MSQRDRMDGVDQDPRAWVGQSEPASHTEHQAALDATLFRPVADFQEIVLELEAGELRVRRPRRR